MGSSKRRCGDHRRSKKTATEKIGDVESGQAIETSRIGNENLQKKKNLRIVEISELVLVQTAKHNDGWQMNALVRIPLSIYLYAFKFQDITLLPQIFRFCQLLTP